MVVERQAEAGERPLAEDPRMDRGPSPKTDRPLDEHSNDAGGNRRDKVSRPIKEDEKDGEDEEDEEDEGDEEREEDV